MKSVKNPDYKMRAILCEALKGSVREEQWQEDENLWGFCWGEGMGPLIWHRLQQEGWFTPSDAMKTYFIDFFRYSTSSMMQMRLALSQMLKQLNMAQIPVICMRGQAVAETLYEPANLRFYSDIDLLGRQENSLMLRQILGNQLDLKPAPNHPDMLVKEAVTLDLHYEPLGIARMDSWRHLTPLRAEDFFKYAETGELAGEQALIVHARVLLPYLCFHAMKHSFERLNWIYDIALLANSIEGELQWDEVLAGIREYRLERPCFYALSYAQAHLGASLPAGLLEEIRPEMDFIERRLFRRHMNHEVIPFLAERLFARMQPDFRHRIEFWRETIYPRREVREQIAGSGCVKCNFIRKRLKQLLKAAWLLMREAGALIRP